MAEGRSFIPPVQITDSLDKPNPGDVKPPDTTYRMVVPVTLALSGLLIIFVLMFMVAVGTRLNTDVWTVRSIADFAIPAIPLAVIIVLLRIMWAGKQYIDAKTERQYLVNLSEHQSTIEQLYAHNSQQLMQMQEMFMQALNTRAANSQYQGVLSVSDSHNGGTETTVDSRVMQNGEEGDDTDLIEDTITTKG